MHGPPCWKCGAEMAPTLMVACASCGAGNAVYIDDGALVRLGFPGDDALRRKAVEADAGVGRILAERLLFFMRRHGGVGLAAPQIGRPEAVAVTEVEGRVRVMVNPRIVAAEGGEIADEGCLSIPGVVLPVERATHIHVETPDGGFHADGLEARAVQHEVDHLAGVLIVDRVREKILRAGGT